ncbi:hypothetical protein HGM15179_016978 [Zosterops borbonicus]|uniref:Uncharacterized protein n=1 Tax=Zosterops borbonicus TaxID=364589 RepID=A0A8K1G1N3_9PASS|nr:hypothetical protein HGM15179_016978 [Zosterops borbonicus]
MGRRERYCNAFFASVFNSKTGYVQDKCPPGLVGGDREWNTPPVIQEEAVRDLLSHLDAHSCLWDQMGSILKGMTELVDELSKLLSIIYHQSWLTGEVPEHWRCQCDPIPKKGWKEDLRNSGPVSLTWVPGRVMEQITLSAITGHPQDNQRIRPSQWHVLSDKPGPLL